MPHVAFVPFTGFRVREDELRALGMSLPGLKQRAEALAQLPALGLLTLAGMTPPPWTCSYHEARAADEALLESVLQERPQLVAVSALTASAEEAYRFCAALRGHGVPTVLGGLHATTCPDEVRRHADAVVGEGEPVWLDVLADAEAANFRPVYRPREPFDLARAPVPRFDLLGLRPRPRWTVQTQRGCPLACEFCAASRLLGPYRDKPVPKLRRELKVIANRVPRPVLELADDNSFIASAHAPAVLDLLAESGARYFTEADWRLGERPDLLPRLAASGCVQVLVGIESLTYRPQGMGPKQAEPARILDAVEAIQSAGVAVLGCFFVGCDGETRQTMDRLADFILASPLADVQLTLQTPFPGTALYRRLQRQGRLLPDRGWSHFTLFDVTYRPDPMSVAELEEAFRQLMTRVFSPEAASRRAAIRRKVWQKNTRLRPCESEP